MSSKTMKFPEGIFGFEFEKEYEIQSDSLGFRRIVSSKDSEYGFWLVDNLALQKILKAQVNGSGSILDNPLQGDFFILTGNPNTKSLNVNLRAPIFEENGEYFQRILTDKELQVRYEIGAFER